MIDIDSTLQLLMQTPVQDGNGKALTLQTKYVWFLLHQTLKNNAANNIFKPPAIRDLAEHTGLTRTGVHNILNALKGAGLLKSNSFAKTGPTTFEYVADPIETLTAFCTNTSQIQGTT